MASLRNIRFLAVDDGVNMLQIVKTVLNGFGALHVTTVRTAEEALSQLEVCKPDILILDIQLARSSGLDLITEVRASPDARFCYMPIIVLSAHSELAWVEAARDAGANEFCNKPLVPAHLFQRIVAVIEKPRAFIRGGAFFGPDRRRKAGGVFVGIERRIMQENALVL